MSIISYSVCNKYGIRDMPVVVKDKKNGLSYVYNGLITKGGCVQVSSSTGSGDHAEVEITIDGGIPYGKPWISPNDEVNI